MTTAGSKLKVTCWTESRFGTFKVRRQVAFTIWWGYEKSDPELFKYVSAYAQPAATFDEVISVWAIQALSELFPVAVWQSDLLSGALTDLSKKKACKVAQFM